jgi:5-methyltetrahydrofolate--homocysteine methyltransferase
MFSDLISAISSLDEEKARCEIERLLQGGVDPFEIIEKGIMASMVIVGQKFEKGELFLPELLLAAEAVKSCNEVLRPFIASEQSKAKGVVVMGTVAGDIHDLGKNIIIRTLESAGFRVVDLGVDVGNGKFIEAARREHADIVALSALLTVTMVRMEEIIKALRAEPGLDKIKVMVGGAPVDEAYALKIGADAYGQDVGEALRKACELVG